MKIIPPGMPFKQALLRGYVGRIESRAYMDAVKGLPCVCCGAPADDAHHPHGVGYKGGATKVPDCWTLPLCRQHHDELHHNVAAWEEKYGSQFEFACLTLAHLWMMGRVGMASN